MTVVFVTTVFKAMQNLIRDSIERCCPNAEIADRLYRQLETKVTQIREGSVANARRLFDNECSLMQTHHEKFIALIRRTRPNALRMRYAPCGRELSSMLHLSNWNTLLDPLT